nr:hypothetical protein [Pyrinomonadaceae bacterium]
MFTKLNRRLILFVIAAIALSTLTVTAQENIWSANTDSTDSIVKDKAVARQSFPTEFRLFNLNVEPLKAQLMSITDQPVALTGNSPASTVILIPNADGVLERFEVFEASNFDAELQEEFPQIRAFSGRGLDDRHAMLKLSLSPQGIQTTVFRVGMVNEYIEPYSQDRTIYAVFSRSQRRGELPWACTTEERNLMSSIHSQVSSLRLPEANTGTIRTMRLAQSVNGEYSNFFGATAPAQVALVLAAVNATLTRTNGTYEKDLAVHLNLIANTTDVFYYNPATDPYSTLGNWNNELMNT